MRLAEEDECPHGMEDPSWCSICKHKGDIIVIDESSPDEILYRFHAKYEGDCKECEFPINIGELCVKIGDGRIVHQRCV